MLSKKIEKALNEQIAKEAYGSAYYLAMASWCDSNGLPGSAKFLYGQSDEERQHMLKIFHYINETDGYAISPDVKQPPHKYSDLKEIFEAIYEHEKLITKAINDLVALSLKEGDYITHNFLQWYVSEQREEENLFNTILDKIKIAGTQAPGLFMIDKELENLIPAKTGLIP